MIVWDGREGGRYDPTDDTWRPVSTLGSPLRRSSNPAVWTGSEMIVWGGDDEPGPHGDAYDPVTDSWRVIATDGAPPDRSFHTGVWTGSEMIVWGGSFGDEVTATGGRYDPAADLWRATTEDGAPAGRQYHTAVWTGSEMIVWGGYDDGSEFDTGARYDPDGDAWTETSRDGAASPRLRHTAVWTGSEMIVWGGSGPDCGDRWDCASGSRYDRARRVARRRRPAFARGRHARRLVRLGMVVWETRSTTRLRASGFYNPASDCWDNASLRTLGNVTIHYNYASVVGRAPRWCLGAPVAATGSGSAVATWPIPVPVSQQCRRRHARRSCCDAAITLPRTCGSPWSRGVRRGSSAPRTAPARCA